MAGSQATIVSPLAWTATHAAAWARADATGLDAAGLDVAAGLANTAPPAPAARTVTTASAPAANGHRRRRGRDRWRPSAGACRLSSLTWSRW